jgi:hypothetical protein
MQWDARITFQNVRRLDRSALKNCFFILGFESIMRHLGFAYDGQPQESFK